MLFVSKRALLLALVACPLVLSGSSTLRGVVNMIEVSKGPEDGAGAPAGGDAAAGAPQAAPAPAGPPPPPAPEAAAPAPPPPPPAQAGPPPGPPPADQQQNQQAPPPGPPAPPAPTTTTPPPPPAGQNQNNPPPPGPTTRPTPPTDQGQQQKPDDNTPPPPKEDGPTKPNGMTKPSPDGGKPNGMTKPTPDAGKPDGMTKPTPGGGPNNVTTLPGDANSIVGCTRMAGNNTCITVGGGNVPAPDNSNAKPNPDQGAGNNNNNNQMPNGNGGGGGGGGWPISTAAPAPPPAPIDAKCDLIGKSAMAGDVTCADALPAYVKGTTDMGWAQQTPTEREESMNDFCQTTCGQSYTDTLMARRRGCNPVTPKGAGTAVVPHGPALFPGTYPGLRLGCVVDPQDGQYCAIKKASPGDGDCAFYMSCCYGELANSLDGNSPDTSFYAMIDQRCPGSAKYRTMTCV